MLFSRDLTLVLFSYYMLFQGNLIYYCDFNCHIYSSLSDSNTEIWAHVSFQLLEFYLDVHRHHKYQHYPPQPIIFPI